MSLSGYELGKAPEVEARFISGTALVDPVTVKCLIRKPDGSISAPYVYGTAPELTRLSQGVFVMQVPLDQEGGYEYRFEGDGPGLVRWRYEHRLRTLPTRFYV